MQIDGQCHCGAIRFRAVLEDAAGLTLCHCTDCQALTGTACRLTPSVTPLHGALLSRWTGEG
ncbi:MAG: hypothetical protein EON59_12180, partial [Alphaproteobacteria bacterium]